MIELRNAAVEAASALGDGRVGRVLEPSPPAVTDEFYADDPINAPAGGRPTVAPIGGDQTWAEVVERRPDLASWAADRNLTTVDPLPPLPDGFEPARLALHRLATYAIAPARHQANGKFGLRWTRGGFGTPFFVAEGGDTQVRVEGDQLVVQVGATVRSAPITTLAAAAEHIGSELDPETAAEHDSPPMGATDQPLAVEVETVAFLDRWWGMGTAALELVRAEPDSVDPGRVQLWPGHFDVAIEIGDEDRRASFGASPGDDGHPAPYLYVAPWWSDRITVSDDDGFWNADGYTGAVLDLAALASSPDPIATAADFFRAGRDRLSAAPTAEGAAASPPS